MTYEMHATMSKALRTEYDDVDDPVQEVADPPGGFAGLDIFEGIEGRGPPGPRPLTAIDGQGRCVAVLELRSAERNGDRASGRLDHGGSHG